MVSGKNAVADNYQVAINAKKSSVSKSSKVQKKDDDFRSMMDKKVQNDTMKPQELQKNEEDAEVSQNGEIVSSQKEEKAPEDGIAMQMMTQYVVLPEQERAPLNWGETVAEDVLPTGIEETVKAVSKEITTSANVPQENKVEQPKETAHTLADASTKVNVSKEGETKAPIKMEDAVKQTNHEGQKERTETVQTIKETVVHSDKKAVDNDNVLEGKEMVWQKETLKEDTISEKVVPKTKAEETLLKFKVGDAVDLSGKKATEDLADKILLRSVGKNNNTFEIQLKPQELGSIKIKLVFEQGKVNVAMFCENQKAAELLSASSAKLSEMIESRTGDQTSVLVQQKEENLFRDGGEKENNHQNAQEQKKQNHNDKNDAEFLDFVQQMRLGLVEIQSMK